MPTEPKLTAGEWFLVQGLNQEFQHWNREHAKQDEPYPIKTRDLMGLLAIVNRLSKEEPKEECNTCDNYINGVTGEVTVYMPCSICQHAFASQYKKKEKLPDG